ncbi:MAG: hypothetical protein ACYSTX_03350 [Planctomycetota bacterium]|jgi:hypothetical protein
MRSDAHNELQDQIRDYYISMGWIAIKEHCLRGKKIDVLAQELVSKRTIANEIELSPRHAVENIIKDLDAGCNEVRVFAISPSVLGQIQNKAKKSLDREILLKVTFYLAEDIIPLKQQKHIQNKAEFNPEEIRNKPGGLNPPK